MDAIILAGGSSMRIYGETRIPKPLLPIGRQSLLSLQTRWLLSKGFTKVHIVCSQEVADGIDDWMLAYSPTSIFVESQRRGTAGAISSVLPEINGKIFYCENVDDLVLESEPMNMILMAEKFPAIILAGKLKSSFGVLRTRGNLVLNFAEKPVMKEWISCGHYAFNTSLLNNGLEFPKEGNLEETLLPQLAEQRNLAVEKYHGTWQTVSTYKDYLQICENFKF